MSNPGIGVGGNSNVNQHVVSADNVDQSEVGYKSSRKVSVVEAENSINTRGVIKSESTDKNFIKFPSLRNRVVQSINQFRKTWMKFSDSQSGMFVHLKDDVLKQNLLSSIYKHNGLIDKLDSKVIDINSLESVITQFEKDYGDVLKFRGKNGPERSDLKVGKSFIYPEAEGKKVQITFTSPDKSVRASEVKEFHDSLRNDSKIKSNFDQYFQAKHDLAMCKEQVASVKQELFEIGEVIKPLLGKAIKQLYQDDAKALQQNYQRKESQIKKGLEDKVSLQHQSVVEKEKSHAESVESQRKVSGELREKIQRLSGVDKKISTSRSRLADFVIKQLKKIMPESQQAAYFNDAATIEQKMEELLKPLKAEKETLQTEASKLHAKEVNLSEEVKKNKSEVWNHQAESKGVNPLKRLANRKFGVHIPVGRQTGGAIGELKRTQKEELASERKRLKDIKSRARKNRIEDKNNLKKVAEGSAKQAADAKYSREGLGEAGERGIQIVQNLLQGAYSGGSDNKWKSEIMEIIDDQDLESLDIIERNIKGWGAEDGAQKYQHIITFIEDNRRDTAL